MDGSFYTSIARILPPELLVLVVLGLFAMILYHLRDCKQARKEVYERLGDIEKEMYERLGDSEKLLHRIAGKLDVDEKHRDEH